MKQRIIKALLDMNLAEGDRIIGVAKLVEVKAEENTEETDDSGDIRAGAVEANVQPAAGEDDDSAE